MNERDIFLKALEIEDENTRVEFVHTECGNNHDLKECVLGLLSSHHGQSEFLQTPAVEQMAENAENAAAATEEFSGTDSKADPLQSPGYDQTIIKTTAESQDDIPLGYLSPSDREDSLGRLGHYEVLEVIGRGAFGIVLKAFDDKLHRVVAIKVLSPDMAATSPARKRFLREARASASVRHENVVAIHAVEDEPIPYLVMEFIPGRTLQDWLNETGPLDVLSTLRLGKQIAEGLAAAHSQDLIHRDIKPGNILLEQGIAESVKLTDFGLARAADDASMTQSGVIAGTPMYMAPEQALAQKLDQRADLFSLGSVLYQMVSGRPPFRAPSTVAVLKRVADENPRSIQDIIPETPTWLCEIISNLHAKDPADRYQSASEVAEVLGNCLTAVERGEEPENVEPGTPSTGSTKSTQQTVASGNKSWKTWGIPAALVLVAVIAFGVANSLGRSTEPPVPPSNPVAAVPVAIQQDDAEISETRTELSTQKLTESEETPATAVAPFDADQARKHQQAWADALGVSVEQEISLGQNEKGEEVALTMVLIPPGEFLMGATDAQKWKWLKAGKAENPDAGNGKFLTLHMEGPQHFVRITKPFWLGQHEFTVGQFRQFVDSTGYQTEVETNGKGAIKPTGMSAERKPELNWSNWHGKNGANEPVANVSWNDAMKCCEWLSTQHPALKFSLPTEAQWEFACRAGTSNTMYDCGTAEELRQYAQFGNDVLFLKQVGQLRPNAFGTYDMLGNVGEWCYDWVGMYDNSVTDDPTGPAEPSEKYPNRAIRGASFLQTLWKVRSTRREFMPPGDVFFDRGFRVMGEIPEEQLLKITNQEDSPKESESSSK